MRRRTTYKRAAPVTPGQFLALSTFLAIDLAALAWLVADHLWSFA